MSNYDRPAPFYVYEFHIGQTTIMLEMINVQRPTWAVATCSVRLNIMDEQGQWITLSVFNNLVVKRSGNTGNLYFNAPSKENGVDNDGNTRYFPFYNIQGKMIEMFNNMFGESLGQETPQQPQQQNYPQQQPQVQQTPPPLVFGDAIQTPPPMDTTFRTREVNPSDINLEEIRF